MKKLLFLLLAVIVVASVFAGCGKTTTTTSQSTPSSSKPTGTITVAVQTFQREATDPIDQESVWGWAMYDSLIRWDENGNLIPNIADSWSFSDNGCVITFKIHKGITFWNGDPLTANDVKFSMDRFSDPAQSTNPWSFFLSKAYNQIDTKVVDDYTFQFYQAHAEPSQLVIMAWVRILDQKYFNAVGQDEFRKHPMGSGPWMFKELVSQTSFTLEANTNYWKPAEIPHFQYYKELLVPEMSTRANMLKTGQVDIVYNPDYDQIDNLKAAGFTAFKMGTPTTGSLNIQGSWLPDAGAVTDIRVRQALSYAINRQELCKTLYYGYAEPGAQFYMYPGCYGWSDALWSEPYDPAKAKELLKEANYPNAFSNPTITCYTSQAGGMSGGTDLFLMLKNYWEAVGLKVQLKILEQTIWNTTIMSPNRVKEGDPNVGWIGDWTYVGFFNPTYQAANEWCSWGMLSCGNDPKADELYKKYASEPDAKKGAQLFNDFQVYAKSMFVNLGIIQSNEYVMWNPKTVSGWTGRTWVSYYDCLNGILPAK